MLVRCWPDTCCVVCQLARLFAGRWRYVTDSEHSTEHYVKTCAMLDKPLDTGKTALQSAFAPEPAEE